VLRRRSWHGYERNRYLRNDGPAGGRVTFREVGHAAGTDLVRNSRGIAIADFWNRGRLTSPSPPGRSSRPLRNEIDNGHGWLEVELVGRRANRDAVGTRVTARVGRRCSPGEV
jgi:hypothetical protein